ncbi:MAG: polymerase subunit sigma [Ferruginibacter sp.]|uniref:RNA polymerase sigma factor n=1 Tax=Ferruginibacter sp. TaxID=1940288 RepID=UPI002658AE14|nr:sigma-70 family RNA polymerase sigma factor [Ferruginibacter sp.]MDB5279690.1 polymerase subunit sigma [Ferruginibacter sp.]
MPLQHCGGILFMEENELIPHLFRTEYRKIIAVLCKLFGIEHIEIAEDITSDTFLRASELWGIKGIPENPTAWLYTVAKNKTKDYLKHHSLFSQKIAKDIQHNTITADEIEIDLSGKNINDSELAMMFAICDPCINAEAQIGLALSLLCGFGVEEIADAFLTNKEVIYKRLTRAKQKLKTQCIQIAGPGANDINNRLPLVLVTLYLLFNEGYYSASQNSALRRDFCVEAMRLTLLLAENDTTAKPEVHALLALMCFHASRFEARLNQEAEIILYEDQDETLWNRELIDRGRYYLNLASRGTDVSKYHLEAAIAWWHTNKEDTQEKWEGILQLYNKLLQTAYSPIAALNRTYALAKANGKEQAIAEAEKLQLNSNHLYHSLLGNLYTGLDNKRAVQHYQTAIGLTKSRTVKAALTQTMNRLMY